MARGETYEDFVEKFKRMKAKTTDDCITPKAVYDGVLTYVRDRYKIGDAPIVRPFYPGGDYEAYDYPAGCVVVDNPPFSILKKIVRFYQERGIRFFLFCDSRFCLGFLDITGLTILSAGQAIEYDNGAEVSTSFVTNLSPDLAIETMPELVNVFKVRPKKTIRKTDDPHIIRSVDVSTMARRGQKIAVPSSVVRPLHLFDFGHSVAIRIDYAEKIKSIIASPLHDIVKKELSPADQMAIEELDAQLEGRGNA